MGRFKLALISLALDKFRSVEKQVQEADLSHAPILPETLSFSPCVPLFIDLFHPFKILDWESLGQQLLFAQRLTQQALINDQAL